MPPKKQPMPGRPVNKREDDWRDPETPSSASLDGDAMIRWCEEKVNVSIVPFGSSVSTWVPLGDLPREKHPETGRSYRDLWEGQKDVLREALQMENGRFKHRLLVFCWPRGEGKSFIVCLIELFRFFNFPRQKIVCGANSKDQVQFVHYDIMKSIVLHSPRLLAEVGRKGVQQKGLYFFDKHGAAQSEIRTISSFSGIVSNINSYTFSEMFQQRKSDFFVQLDGSIRNIPNAMGCIDSTVSEKNHQLYRLYDTFTRQKDPTLYVSYRYSAKGDPADYWNPNMTQAQLDSYRAKFPFGEFERFFLNVWEAGGEKVFTPDIVEATHYLGVDHAVNTQRSLIDLIKNLRKYRDAENRMKIDGQLGMLCTIPA